MFISKYTHIYIYIHKSWNELQDLSSDAKGWSASNVCKKGFESHGVPQSQAPKHT